MAKIAENRGDIDTDDRGLIPHVHTMGGDNRDIIDGKTVTI